MTTGAAESPLPGDPRRILGRSGEELAARWYESRGYRILERNWRRRGGEVDLIVRRGGTVVFCEVKVRSTDRFGTGAESVPLLKQRRIRQLAVQWLAERVKRSSDWVDLRFDVVSITSGNVEVIEDAF